MGKGCVMMTMKCKKKWKRAEKNIKLFRLLLNVVLLDKKKKEEKKSDHKSYGFHRGYFCVLPVTEKDFFYRSFQQILGQIDNRNSSKITAQ